MVLLSSRGGVRSPSGAPWTPDARLPSGAPCEWSIDVHLIQQDANRPYARGRVSAKGGARLIGNGSDAIFGRGMLFWVANRARYLKQRRPKNAGLSKNNFVMAITSCEAESISRCSRGRDGSTPNTTHGFPVAVTPTFDHAS